MFFCDIEKKIRNTGFLKKPLWDIKIRKKIVRDIEIESPYLSSSSLTEV